MSAKPGTRTEMELAIMDAALRGEQVGGDHEPLAELTRTLRLMRPRPRVEFAAALDERAASGFKSRTQAPGRAAGEPRGLDGRRRRNRSAGIARRVYAHPRLSLGAAAAVATAAIAVPLALSAGGSRHEARPAAVFAPATTTPAREEGAPRGAIKQAQAAPATGAREASARGAAAPAQAPASPRQVERTAALDVGVAPSSIQSAAQRVFTLVSALGGYVRQSNVSSGDGAQGGATFDVRVPSSNLSGAIASLAHLGHVRSESNATNDVTEQFDSLRRSLAELGAERATVLRQLAAASSAQQESALKERLHSLDGRIRQLQGSLSALAARVNYTSLALSLTAEAAAAPGAGNLTPGGAARDAAQILDAALAVLVLAAAAFVPLAVLAAAAGVVLALTRRRLRERALDAA